MLIFIYGHKVCFCQDLFGFLKNGQKKCPKLKIPKYFWKKNKVNIINSPKGLKTTEEKEPSEKCGKDNTKQYKRNKPKICIQTIHPHTQ
jgi:hypothetical protein